MRQLRDELILCLRDRTVREISHVIRVRGWDDAENQGPKLRVLLANKLKSRRKATELVNFLCAPLAQPLPVRCDMNLEAAKFGTTEVE